MFLTDLCTKLSFFGAVFICIAVTNVACGKVESNPQEFAQFWQSVDRIVAKTNNEWGAIADKISHASRALNGTSSECYRIIEAAFRNGIKQEWSAKCKYSVI